MEGEDLIEETPKQVFRGEILAPPLIGVKAPYTPSPYTIGNNLSFDDQHKELLQSYLAFNGFGSFLVNIYDQWITKDLKTFIENERIFLHNGTGVSYVAFRNVNVSKPKFSNGRDDLLPWQAILNGLTYANSVDVEAYEVRRNIATGKEEEVGLSEHIPSLFSIPCMVMSYYCHYHGLNNIAGKQKLLELKEDPYIPGGWFIVEGSPKILLIQEMLRQNRLMLISLGKEAIPVCRMLIPTRRSTILIQLNVGKSSNYKFQFAALGKVVKKTKVKEKKEKEGEPKTEEGKTTSGKTEKSRYHSINAYLLTKYLLQRSGMDLTGMVDEDLAAYINTMLYNNQLEDRDQTVFQITSLIILVSNREKAKRIIAKLIPTIAKYFGKLNIDPVAHIGEKIKRSIVSTNQARKAKTPKRGANGKKEEFKAEPLPTDEELKARVDKLIEDEFYPQLNKLQDSQKYYSKAMMAVIMMAMMSEYQAGLRSINDKNGWDVKQLESGGVLMKKLFQASWRHFITQKILKKGEKVKTLENVVIAMSEVGTGITDTFKTSFKSGKWGVRKVHMRENVARNADRASRASFYSDVTKVDVEAPRQGAQEVIREVQATQKNFIDPTETPEGDSCGLLKNLSVTTSISVDGSELYEASVLRDLESSDMYSILPSPAMTAKLMINGKFVGFCQGVKTKDHLLELRRSNPNYAQVGLSVFIDPYNYLMVYSDGARPIRPVLVVDPDGYARISKHPELWNRSFYELMLNGCVEYIDPAEQENFHTLIANSFDVLAKARDDIGNLRSLEAEILGQLAEFKPGEEVLLIQGGKQQFVRLSVLQQRLSHVRASLKGLTSRGYTHCELNVGASMMGIITSLINQPETAPAARGLFTTSMYKGSIETPAVFHESTFEGNKSKAIMGASKPFYETQMAGPLGYHDFPNTFNLSVLVAPYSGYGMEDSFILDKQVVDAGLLRYYKYTTFKATFSSGGDVTESLEKPVLHSLREQQLYRHLVEKTTMLPSGLEVKAGTPRIGAYLSEGMAVIGKVKRIKTGGIEKVENESVELSLTNEGIVDNVYVRTDDNYTLVVVRIRSLRLPMIGDKAQVGTQAQKATYGLIEDHVNLPVGPHGEVPSIIFNPHAIVSRMTAGLLRELLVGTAGGLINKVYDSSPFRDNRLVDEEVRRVLVENGYPSTGSMRFKSGKTGEMIQGLLHVGTGRVTELKHTSKEKLQERAGFGPVKEETRQAPRGKKGAIRFGEMEFQSMISHGAAANIKERGCDLSDAFNIVFCKKCFTPSLANFTNREYKCPFCGIRSKISSNDVSSGVGGENSVSSAFGKATVPFSLLTLIRLGGVLGFYFGFTFTKDQTQLGLMRTNLPSGEEAESNEFLEDPEEAEEASPYGGEEEVGSYGELY